MTQHENLIDTIINGIALCAAIIILIITVPLLFIGYLILATGIWILGTLWSLIE